MSLAPASINVIALGYWRNVAVSITTIFAGTPYRLAAVLDLEPDSKEFAYSAHNAGVVLHCLYPRPQVLITGGAILDDMTNEAIDVFNAYVKRLDVKDTLVINLQAEGWEKGKWAEHIMRRLDGHFLNKN